MAGSSIKETESIVRIILPRKRGACAVGLSASSTLNAIVLHCYWRPKYNEATWKFVKYCLTDPIYSFIYAVLEKLQKSFYWWGLEVISLSSLQVINDFRESLLRLFLMDKVCVPLVYTQVSSHFPFIFTIRNVLQKC